MPPTTVVTFREPVTLSRAAEATGCAREALRSLVRNGKLKPKASDVATHALLFDLWEVEAALAARRAYRRVAAPVRR